MGAAGCNAGEWSLSFTSPAPRIKLREGGYFAGHSSIQALQSSISEQKEAREMVMDKKQVDEFYFVDNETNFVSFFRLPLEYGNSSRVSLRGTTDEGFCAFMENVSAWKVKFGEGTPQLLVMKEKEKRWIKLEKPLKLYEKEFLSAFGLLRMLDIVRKNVDASENTIWKQLHSAYGYLDERLTESDILEHLPVLKKLVTRDTVLGSSDFVQKLLMPRKRKPCAVEGTSYKRQKCESEDESCSEDDEESGESICAICDDGGDLLCCDGPCLRSFHGYKRKDTLCDSLCLTEAEVKHSVNFFCQNCAVNEHQCFACGNLGSSQGPSQEVFLCDVALCGRFYHLSCLTKLLGYKNVDKEFTCPLHSCFKCHQPEKQEEGLWLYPCRRCPRAWHQNCSGVSFEEGDMSRRGWKIGNTRFLYCMNHVLDPVTCTPKRIHLKFPLLRGKNPLSKLKPSKSGKHPSEDLNKARSSCGAVFSVEEIENPVLDIVNSCKVAVERISSKLILPSTIHSSSNKNCHLNRITSLLNAFHKASNYLRRGGSLEEAQLRFPLKDLKLLESSKEALRVYMSPMLYGMRYSSFGRHFTRTDKLKEIVDRLSVYIDSGDMVVDLCCGANEFSRLVAERLVAMNKFCRFKNYDFIQPSDTFHFERRDYMTVTRQELCPGDKLVMGLNPPFGVKGQLASKFLEHCATFSPKIIVLIAPEETRRLDRNYVLTWEDREILKGDAFYLPGSVDAEGRTIKQENKIPPVLYFWSRADFAEAHRVLAMKHGHSSVADAKLGEKVDTEWVSHSHEGTKKHPPDEKAGKVAQVPSLRSLSSKDKIAGPPPVVTDSSMVSMDHRDKTTGRESCQDQLKADNKSQGVWNKRGNGEVTTDLRFRDNSNQGTWRVAPPASRVGAPPRRRSYCENYERGVIEPPCARQVFLDDRARRHVEYVEALEPCYYEPYYSNQPRFQYPAQMQYQHFQPVFQHQEPFYHRRSQEYRPGFHGPLHPQHRPRMPYQNQSTRNVYYSHWQ